MAEAVPETIREASKAAEIAARPNVLVSVLCLGAFGFCALLVWRLEVRADAQILVMQEMAKEIAHGADETRELRRAFTTAGIRVRAAAAVARDAE